jgi:hypothetical protein
MPLGLLSKHICGSTSKLNYNVFSVFIFDVFEITETTTDNVDEIGIRRFAAFMKNRQISLKFDLVELYF